MTKRTISGGVLALTLAALAAITALTWAGGEEANAACGANACMTVTGPAAPVSTGAQFTITLDASNAGAAGGYQWELQFSSSAVTFVSATENTGGTGANLCAPANDNSGSAPAGKTWIGLGAGCVSGSGTIPASVMLTTITLQCNAQAPVGTVSELHLVTGGVGGEDPTFGTTFLAVGGAALPTDTTDSSVQCGLGTPIATNTPTSTNTPPPTNTPLPPTPTCVPNQTCPTATPTFPPGFTRTPTPTGTSAPLTPPPGSSPTLPAGTPGGTNATPPTGITLPGTGGGGTGDSQALLLAAAGALIATIGFVGWYLRRRGVTRAG